MSAILTMPELEYHADPRPVSLSASIIHVLCSQSPRHAWTAHPKLNPQFVPEEAEVMDLGKIAHSILLEGVDVAEVMDFPDWRTKAAREARDAARIAGKVPILKHKWDDVLAMVSAARVQLDAHKDAKLAFKNGKPEQVILWEENGVKCRARVDWLMNDLSALYDYKTRSGSANPEMISRTLFTEGWHTQAHWYLRGLKAVTGREAQFKFICQETYPPYALSVIALGPDSMMIAEKQCLWAIEKFKECLDSGLWPGYPDRTCHATLPAYIESAWLERELEGQ